MPAPKPQTEEEDVIVRRWEAQERSAKPIGSDRPPGYIGGISTALQNAIDKPLMTLGLAHLRFWGLLGCNLESSCCEDFYSVIITNSTLIKLEVSMYICEEQTESEVQELCERFSSLASVSEKKK
ncbi:unnamed protein product [Ranitomeya imitator]|uniref:Uncharacterized protein n=1 Tax=Ranitomeya imitator TaxID=111125 RepID=A0ABN9KVX6_9NEOB|nr:unnamed protein product [Ranitomeya imitator]